MSFLCFLVVGVAGFGPRRAYPGQRTALRPVPAFPSRNFQYSARAFTTRPRLQLGEVRTASRMAISSRKSPPSIPPMVAHTAPNNSDMKVQNERYADALRAA